MIEALNLIECQKIKKKAGDEVCTFQSLKNKLKLLNLFMAVIAALLGGINGSFMQGFTIASKWPDAMSLGYTYLYLFTALFCGFMQLKTIN